MIRYHAQTTPRDQRIPEGGERGGELILLAVHRHPECLEEAGEVGRPRPRAQCLPNGVHKVVARHERAPLPPSHDAPAQATCSWGGLVRILRERFTQTFFPPRIE